MTTNRTRPTGGARRSAGTPRVRRGRRGCLCQDGEIDYKDVGAMRRFVNERGKIGSPRRTGASAKCQRELAIAVKRARHLALIPYAPHHKHMTDSVQESAQQRNNLISRQPAPDGQQVPAVAQASDSASDEPTVSKARASSSETDDDASTEELGDVEQNGD